MQSLFQILLLVRDYDEAIEFYTKKLEFKLIEDTPRSTTKRWVIVQPKSDNSCKLLLAKARNKEEEECIGRQTGGRVFLFMHTDNLDRDYQNLLKHNIKIKRKPSTEYFGKVLVFEDLYGNLWDLIEPIK